MKSFNMKLLNDFLKTATLYCAARASELFFIKKKKSHQCYGTDSSRISTPLLFPPIES